MEKNSFKVRPFCEVINAFLDIYSKEVYYEIDDTCK
jgi:hypothetical protein